MLFKSMYIFSFFALFFIIIPSHVYSAVYTWDNESGDGSWENPQNWSPDASSGEPDNDDSVIFDSTAASPSSLNTDRLIRDLRFETGNHTLNLNGRKLTVTNVFSAYSNATVAGTYNLLINGNHGTLQIGANPSAKAALVRMGWKKLWSESSTLQLSLIHI